MSIQSKCPGCMMGKHEEHNRDWNIKPGIIGGSYCGCKGNCTLFASGWLDDELKRAKYRTKNRETTAEQAWQEGYQAGLWYGKSGQPSNNPYQFKESLDEDQSGIPS